MALQATMPAPRVENNDVLSSVASPARFNRDALPFTPSPSSSPGLILPSTPGTVPSNSTPPRTVRETRRFERAKQHGAARAKRKSQSTADSHGNGKKPKALENQMTGQHLVTHADLAALQSVLAPLLGSSLEPPNTAAACSDDQLPDVGARASGPSAGMVGSVAREEFLEDETHKIYASNVKESLDAASLAQRLGSSLEPPNFAAACSDDQLPDVNARASGPSCGMVGSVASEALEKDEDDKIFAKNVKESLNAVPGDSAHPGAGQDAMQTPLLLAPPCDRLVSSHGESAALCPEAAVTPTRSADMSQSAACDARPVGQCNSPVLITPIAAIRGEYAEPCDQLQHDVANQGAYAVGNIRTPEASDNMLYGPSLAGAYIGGLVDRRQSTFVRLCDVERAVQSLQGFRMEEMVHAAPGTPGAVSGLHSTNTEHETVTLGTYENLERKFADYEHTEFDACEDLLARASIESEEHQTYVEKYAEQCEAKLTSDALFETLQNSWREYSRGLDLEINEETSIARTLRGELENLEFVHEEYKAEIVAEGQLAERKEVQAAHDRYSSHQRRRQHLELECEYAQGLKRATVQQHLVDELRSQMRTETSLHAVLHSEAEFWQSKYAEAENENEMLEIQRGEAARVLAITNAGTDGKYAWLDILIAEQLQLQAQHEKDSGSKNAHQKKGPVCSKTGPFVNQSAEQQFNNS